MEYTDVLKMKIRQFGRLGYTPERIASIMRSSLTKRDLQQLMDDLLTPGSIAYTEYRTGADSAEFDRDVALDDMGCSNDPDRRELFEELSLKRKVTDMINEKFGL